MRGLPGGSSLHRVLAEHRGIRPALSVAQILAWADAHHAATGRWPTQMSGPVVGAYGQTWHSIDDRLRDGRRGLPGGMTLARLLAEHRGARNMHTWGQLAVAQILAWADAHRDATGDWPTRLSGPVLGASGEFWHTIDCTLYQGWRGLPGGSSLAKLLAEHRGMTPRKRRPDLSVAQDPGVGRRAPRGDRPMADRGCGPGDRGAGESWGAISGSLARGGRGLPGGSSLAKLLAEHRGARNPKALPRLCVEQILAWADAHREATGRWPSLLSGAVRDAPGEDWGAINLVLSSGHRGLPGGSSLARLLDEHRPERRREPDPGPGPRLGRGPSAATGRWPDAHCGPVRDAPGESWIEINSSLSRGYRGLPGGTSLAQLLGRSLDPAAQGPGRR